MRGSRSCWCGDEDRTIADQRVGVVAEQIGVGVGDAGEFLARHGMAAEKERAVGWREKVLRRIATMRTLVLQASVTSACGGA